MKNVIKKVNGKREKVNAWIEKKKAWIVGGMTTFILTTLATVPAMAIDTGSVTSNVRSQATPVYLIALGVVCIIIWAKGKMASAFITLAAGLFFGAVFIYPDFATSLMTWMKGILS